jgi:STE24 endopeptidase
MNPYLVAIVALVVFTAALDILADALNLRNFSPAIPPEFQDTYEPARYAEAMRYQRERARFQIATRAVFTVGGLAFLLAGGFAWADGLAARVAGEGIPRALAFVGVLSAIRWIAQLPLSVYDTFVLEERYGFNRTTPRTFALDQLKGVLLTAVLGAAVFSGLVWFFERSGSLAWLWAWLALTGFQLAVVFLAPVVILPLFNKFVPLPEGELKREIETYARAQRFTMSGVFTMDGSRRSTRANAYFTGFGRFRRIVLFDTLIARHTTRELVAVLAHEIGHFKRGHIVKGLVLGIIGSGVMLRVFGALMGNPALSEAFGVSEVTTGTSLVFIGYLLSPVQRLTSLGTMALSRRHEFEADEYAAQTYGDPASLASALKKLTVDNLSHLTPHRLKVLLDYSHPPVLARVARLRALRVG